MMYPNPDTSEALIRILLKETNCSIQQEGDDPRSGEVAARTNAFVRSARAAFVLRGFTAGRQRECCKVIRCDFTLYLHFSPNGGK